MTRTMLEQYFSDVTADLNRNSQRIRTFFSTHAPSAGNNREDMVAKLLKEHILPLAGIGTGLVMSATGEFSNQSDVVLFDPASNGPIFQQSPIPIWLLEAVYSVIEVKTQLTPTTIADTIAKCRRFKTLPKRYSDSHGRQKISDHLFILWSFEAPNNTTAKSNLISALSGVPQSEQPDFIVVPGKFLVRGGGYHDLSTNGQAGSSHYQSRLQAVGGDPNRLLPEPFEMLDLGDNTLTAFLYWLNSWLYAAGPRRPDLVSYYGNRNWGTRV